MSAEERRSVTEDLTEEELTIFDLLTKPVPALEDAERELVKASAKRLLANIHEKLVLDWRRKAATMGFALDEPDTHPDPINMLWTGQSVSRDDQPSWCGTAEARLWFNIPHQGGLFVLG